MKKQLLMIINTDDSYSDLAISVHWAAEEIAQCATIGSIKTSRHFYKEEEIPENLQIGYFSIIEIPTLEHS